MALFGLFRKKEGTTPQAEHPAKTEDSGKSCAQPRQGTDTREVSARPRSCGMDFMRLYREVPEVFWPVEFIAGRIASAPFVLRRESDDGAIWGNRRINQLLARPNCLMSWRDMVHLHFIYKLVTGNSYLRAAMPEELKDAQKWRMCDNFWILPADYVEIMPVLGVLPIFGIADESDLINCYQLNYGLGGIRKIEPWQVWHDRDGMPDYVTSAGFLKGMSRLMAVRKPISNLLAVYEARNVLYVKRGGLGYIVSEKKDATGSVALTPKEKQELLSQNLQTYGLGEGQVPFGISDQPLSFVRTNLSIQELQPFEETLADAVEIAGVFGIPPELVPRKDHSTFNNQAAAEKSVYTSTIIPMAQEFCRDLTTFLGLDRAGMYMDVDFSGVDCLQSGLKERENVKTVVNTRCQNQFAMGMITLNDWRAQIGMEPVGNPIFDKLKIDMTNDELAMVERMQGGSTIIVPDNDTADNTGDTTGNDGNTAPDGNDGGTDGQQFPQE